MKEGTKRRFRRFSQRVRQNLSTWIKCPSCPRKSAKSAFGFRFGRLKRNFKTYASGSAANADSRFAGLSTKGDSRLNLRAPLSAFFDTISPSRAADAESDTNPQENPVSARRIQVLP